MQIEDFLLEFYSSNSRGKSSSNVAKALPETRTYPRVEGLTAHQEYLHRSVNIAYVVLLSVPSAHVKEIENCGVIALISSSGLAERETDVRSAFDSHVSICVASCQVFRHRPKLHFLYLGHFDV